MEFSVWQRMDQRNSCITRPRWQMHILLPHIRGIEGYVCLASNHDWVLCDAEEKTIFKPLIKKQNWLRVGMLHCFLEALALYIFFFSGSSEGSLYISLKYTITHWVWSFFMDEGPERVAHCVLWVLFSPSSSRLPGEKGKCSSNRRRALWSNIYSSGRFLNHFSVLVYA